MPKENKKNQIGKNQGKKINTRKTSEKIQPKNKDEQPIKKVMDSLSAETIEIKRLRLFLRRKNRYEGVG